MGRRRERQEGWCVDRLACCSARPRMARDSGFLTKSFHAQTNFATLLLNPNLFSNQRSFVPNPKLHVLNEMSCVKTLENSQPSENVKYKLRSFLCHLMLPSLIWSLEELPGWPGLAGMHKRKSHMCPCDIIMESAPPGGSSTKSSRA